MICDEFSFHTMFCETSCVLTHLYIPEPWQGDMKHIMSFAKYCLK